MLLLVREIEEFDLTGSWILFVGAVSCGCLMRAIPSDRAIHAPMYNSVTSFEGLCHYAKIPS
jgi:hypothetical protein